MAASSSSLPFSPFILGLFLSISVFISLISPSHANCYSQMFRSSRNYTDCTDLAALGAALHFTYNTTNRSLAVAFVATPPSPDGWVAWGINTAGGMVGSQALIAYKLNGNVGVHPYNLTSYGAIDPVKSLSIETWDLAAEETDGVITLFAVVEFPVKVGINSQVWVWQVGPVVSGKPAVHEFKPENLMAKVILPVEGTTAVLSNINTVADKKERGNKALIIAIAGVIGACGLVVCAFLLWRKCTAKHTGSQPRNLIIGEQKQMKLDELPLFDFEKLETATNNFHLGNMLGKGGFGPVYKGILEDGQEIAVKRLSKASGQGVEEFMNEVVVISKLQHRNLVRLLGCCIERDEQMLVYEFMPNNSLDAFLFDPLQKKVLDWRKRFNIIEGVARGILYLHRDSRLRIIHRDLKASNILLDGEMTPKISDFGLARIFKGGEDDEANTRRVVGTYGYMPPEYAMEGLFSEKSDVYSFGVLLLEIVSGRRNTSFYNNNQSLGLVGIAWKLWLEENIISLIDPEIWDPCFESSMLRCIHIGLLCVQEIPRERPTISTVLLMLISEITHLPPLGKVAFVHKQNAKSAGSSQKSQSNSNNIVTLSEVQGR